MWCRSFPRRGGIDLRNRFVGSANVTDCNFADFLYLHHPVDVFHEIGRNVRVAYVIPATVSPLTLLYSSKFRTVLQLHMILSFKVLGEPFKLLS